MSSKYNKGYTDGFIDGYLSKLKPQHWEEVTVDPRGAGHTYRLRVPGGWLYRTVTYRYPELHMLWESKQLSEAVSEKELQKAIEIVAQTTVFVPEEA